MAAQSSVPTLVYRALLRLYPARFHDEFAPDMALDFADASDDGWRAAGWAGLLAVWARTAGDLVRSLAIQWVRTGIPLAALVGLGVAVTTAAATLTVAPETPLFARVAPGDRELVTLFFLVACVLLIVATTIIFTLWFLRPLLRADLSRRSSTQSARRGGC